jgi:hypothetical protein
MRCSAASSRIIDSPILARAKVSSPSSGSARALRPGVPVSRKARFQLSSSWAGTWRSRETAIQPLAAEKPQHQFGLALHAPPLWELHALAGYRLFARPCGRIPLSASLLTIMITQTGVRDKLEAELRMFRGVLPTHDCRRTHQFESIGYPVAVGRTGRAQTPAEGV